MSREASEDFKTDRDIKENKKEGQRKQRERDGMRESWPHRGF